MRTTFHNKHAGIPRSNLFVLHRQDAGYARMPAHKTKIGSRASHPRKTVKVAMAPVIVDPVTWLFWPKQNQDPVAYMGIGGQ